MGIEVEESHIILSTDGVVQYLQSEGITRVFVVGTESMTASIENAGILTSCDNPQAVVLGYDTEITYEKIELASHHLSRGVDLLATHPDIACPTPKGPVPDVGAFLSLFEASIGVTPKRVFGKPNIEMVAHLIRKHRVLADEVVIIGDRLYTDYAMAQNIGADFILVLSGESTREDVERLQNPPSLVIRDVGRLLAAQEYV